MISETNQDVEMTIAPSDPRHQGDSGSVTSIAAGVQIVIMEVDEVARGHRPTADHLATGAQVLLVNLMRMLLCPYRAVIREMCLTFS